MKQVKIEVYLRKGFILGIDLDNVCDINYLSILIGPLILVFNIIPKPLKNKL